MEKETIDLGYNRYAVTLYDKENEKVFISVIEVNNTNGLELALEELEFIAYGFYNKEEYMERDIIKI